MQIGTLKWFNFTKGYGFIEPSDRSRGIFLHISALEQAGIKNIDSGQKLSFETVTQKGKLSATNIKLL
ncbi:cold-shock protein (plasmid) [Candidatus Megaera polyxenophila]|jgi:CspA family cold shock protein|nr:cold-shock protein [Candidatus Megaera polyxenophila]WHA06513.1 cold-shock protein [Candidatus Megaera polyxenophila]WHA07609.1 cold-shock protein [Candidatus Megaera polyxenophila]